MARVAQRRERKKRVPYLVGINPLTARAAAFAAACASEDEKAEPNTYRRVVQTNCECARPITPRHAPSRLFKPAHVCAQVWVPMPMMPHETVVVISQGEPPYRLVWASEAWLGANSSYSDAIATHASVMRIPIHP